VTGRGLRRVNPGGLATKEDPARLSNQNPFPVAKNQLATSNARSTYTCIGVAATEDADAQKVMAASWAAMTAHSDAMLVVL